MRTEIQKTILIAIILSLCTFAISQPTTTIYLFHGQGSDQRIFDSLEFDSIYNIVRIHYDTPDKGATMESFARHLSLQIDTTKPFILIGMSLGGMLCAELQEIVEPEMTILISSAQNRTELPFRYRFQRLIPLYEIIPAPCLLAGAKWLQPLVEPDRNRNKATFKAMLGSKEPSYIKRTIRMIIRWERVTNTKEPIRIHGREDHTIPIRNITEVHYIIANGSHMMTLTRGQEISKILKDILPTKK